MGQAIATFLPMLLFMLAPAFIPVITSVVGRIYDGVTGSGQTQTAAQRATEAARRRAASARMDEAPARHRALAS